MQPVIIRFRCLGSYFSNVQAGMSAPRVLFIGHHSFNKRIRLPMTPNLNRAPPLANGEVAVAEVRGN
jgi:hypothetical protein